MSTQNPDDAHFLPGPPGTFGGSASTGGRAYPLAVRDHSLTTAIGLLLQTLPYALMRLWVSLAFSLAGVIWIVVTFGGAAWLSAHIAGAFGLVWLLICLVGVGWFWGTILRYLLHLIECGHVAVLTELITVGAIANGGEPMFAYGKRLVTERFGQINVLFALNVTVRGVIESFHRTLDWLSELLPVPGLDGFSNLINLVLRAATRYLDKVLLSYNLARRDEDPWRSAQEGLVYYCQNAKPILITSAWIVALEYVLTFVLWIVLLAPAAIVTLMLPGGVRESGAIVTILIAALLAASLRSAFVKPLFLIMIMVRFHALIENQPINQEWNDWLSQLSEKFRSIGQTIGRPATWAKPA